MGELSSRIVLREILRVEWRAGVRWRRCLEGAEILVRQGRDVADVLRGDAACRVQRWEDQACGGAGRDDSAGGWP